jgi:hypothetical protein
VQIVQSVLGLLLPTRSVPQYTFSFDEKVNLYKELGDLKFTAFQKVVKMKPIETESVSSR